jgi:hypothetical protein
MWPIWPCTVEVWSAISFELASRRSAVYTFAKGTGHLLSHSHLYGPRKYRSINNSIAGRHRAATLTVITGTSRTPSRPAYRSIPRLQQTPIPLFFTRIRIRTIPILASVTLATKDRPSADYSTRSEPLSPFTTHSTASGPGLFRTTPTPTSIPIFIPIPYAWKAPFLFASSIPLTAHRPLLLCPFYCRYSS